MAQQQQRQQSRAPFSFLGSRIGSFSIDLCASAVRRQRLDQYLWACNAKSEIRDFLDIFLLSLHVT